MKALESCKTLNLVQANTAVKIQIKENPFQVLMTNSAKFSLTSLL